MGQCLGKLPFLGHFVNKFQRPTILQSNIKKTGQFLENKLRLSVAWVVSKSAFVITEGYLHIPMFSECPLIGKRPFQDGAMPGKNYGFSGYIVNKFRRPNIFQLNIEGLTASEINVLRYLALQFEAPIMLLQETRCINAEKLVGYFPASN